MLMEAGLDTGPVLLSQRCPIAATDDAQIFDDLIIAGRRIEHLPVAPEHARIIGIELRHAETLIVERLRMRIAVQDVV